MASKNKLKKPNEEESDDSYSSDSSGDDDDGAYSGNEVIQVEFEGRNPMQSDFHGVRQLLQQLFLKSDINLSELADTVIDQNFIGSVVIQSFLGEDDDEDSDDDENFDSETIFGLTSAVNISKTQSHGCIEDLRKHILTKSNQFAKQTDKEIFENVLNDETQQIGLIINERFINIPAQISVPMLENLSDEIKHAAVKKPKYDFKHYIMIVKFNRKKGTAKPTNPDDDFYTNGEEEVLDEYANASFEFSVESETDTTLAGNWTEKDSELVPHRKVVIFDANKFPLIINAIKELIN